MGAMPDFPAGPIQTGAAYLYETLPLALPQTATKTLFQFQGIQYRGPAAGVEILDVFGFITTTVGAVANASKLQLIGTTPAGVAATAVDLCSTLDINGLTAGYSLSITGTLATAMTDNAYGVQIAQVTPIHVAFGTTCNLSINCAGSDGGVGLIRWYLVARASYGTKIAPQVS